MVGSAHPTGGRGMADAKIDVVGPGEIPLIAELYSQIFRPARDAAFFRRRFQGRANVLMLVASQGDEPVGFFIGFELKPTARTGTKVG